MARVPLTARKSTGGHAPRRQQVAPAPGTSAPPGLPRPPAHLPPRPHTGTSASHQQAAQQSTSRGAPARNTYVQGRNADGAAHQTAQSHGYHPYAQHASTGNQTAMKSTGGIAPRPQRVYQTAMKSTGGIAPRTQSVGLTAMKSTGGIAPRHQQVPPPDNDTEPVVKHIAAETWGGDSFTVLDPVDNGVLVKVPVKFVTEGKCGKLAYLLEQVHLCFEEQGDLELEGNRLDLQDELRPALASTVFVRNDGRTGEACTPLEGPQLDEGNSDDDSDDNQSSSTVDGEADLRESVIARDSFCLVSSAPSTDCVAGLIVPADDPMGLQDIVGVNSPWDSSIESGIFQAQSALLLRDDLYESYKEGKWALFADLDSDSFIVHGFDKGDPSSYYHGTVIPQSRFRCSPQVPQETVLPNRNLLRFHYQQCAMRNFRGYGA
ncbi:hypothetical protein CF328_g4463 [Tilletia controversa]|nr:hypothetical protein CF328_g4463 [Tilletia controversa]